MTKIENCKKYIEQVPGGQEVYGGMRDAYDWTKDHCHWQGLIWAAKDLKIMASPENPRNWCNVFKDSAEAVQKISRGCGLPNCAEGYIEQLNCKQFAEHPLKEADNMEHIGQGQLYCENSKTGCVYGMPSAGYGSTIEYCGASEGKKRCIDGYIIEGQCVPYQCDYGKCVGVASGLECVNGVCRNPRNKCPGGFYEQDGKCLMTCQNNNTKRNDAGMCMCDAQNPCTQGFECIAGVCHNPGVTTPLMGFCPDGWTLAVATKDGKSKCIARKTPHGKCDVVSEFPNDWSQEQRKD